MCGWLAFSVAVNVKPDILIVDEALAVGNIFFQQKCMIRMRKIMERGTTILFVSHDPATIQSLCRRGVLLDKGQVYMIGPAKEVSQEYFKMIHVNTNMVLSEVAEEQKNAKKNVDIISPNDKSLKTLPQKEFIDGGKEFTKRCAERFGDDIGWIVNVKILNSKGEITNRIEYREPFTVRVYIKAKRDIENYCVGFRVWDDKGMSIAGTLNIKEGIVLPKLKKDDKLIIDFKVENIFCEGNYNILAAIEIPVVPHVNHVVIDAAMGAEYFQIIGPEKPEERMLTKVWTKVIVNEYMVV